jgi:type I pantothenate kinase
MGAAAPVLKPAPLPLSPYRLFARSAWAALRADTPMTLSPEEVEALSGVIERVSPEEVVDIYLPMSRLLNFYVRAAQKLHSQTSRFFNERDAKVPFILGVAGSVAVGKSTTARILRALLARWDQHRRVDLVATDGFLLDNATLAARGLMDRKGFPESYDQAALLAFLAKVKAGETAVTAPIYSHFNYDIVPAARQIIDRPDILIVEGLNVLQPAKLPRDGEAIPFVSDFFDFSIYIHAAPETLEDWYVRRFLTLRETAFRDPAAYFHRYAELSEADARDTALRIWRRINLPNLLDNILPTRQRASLILNKAADHRVESVALRRL